MVGNTNNLYFFVDNYMVMYNNFTPPKRKSRFAVSMEQSSPITKFLFALRASFQVIREFSPMVAPLCLAIHLKTAYLIFKRNLTVRPI